MKSKKRKKIRKKQKKLDRRISGERIDLYSAKINSYRLKYPVLSDKLESFKSTSPLNLNLAEEKESVSAKQWSSGMKHWESIEKNKSKQVKRYQESHLLIDSSYTNLLYCFAFYLNVVPKPAYIEVKNEIPVDSVKSIAEPPVVEVDTVEEIKEDKLLEFLYSVQVGAYRSDRIPGRLQNIDNIFTTLAPNGLYRFSAGKFATIKQADAHKNKIRSAGITDAFVVAYLNGERISITQAKKIETTGTYLLTEDKKEITIKNIPAKSSTFFTVQLGVFRGKPDLTKIPKDEPVFSSKLNTGLTKYTYGNFNNHSEAIKTQNIIRESGISDAYVVKVQGGEIATVGQQKQPDIPVVQNKNYSIENIQKFNGLFYSVQIGVFKQAQNPDRFMGIDPIYFITESGFYKYFTGICSNINETVLIKNKVRNFGISDAFVVAFYQGNKIELSSARRIMAEGDAQIEQSQKVIISRKTTPKPNQSEANPKYETSKKRGELFFTIQLGIFGSKLENLSGVRIEPLYQFQTSDNRYKLTCGKYNSYETAQEDRNKVVITGYSDAYIIAFFNGKSVLIREAQRLLENRENIIFAKEERVRIRSEIDPSTISSEDIEYRVQIASFREPAHVNVVASYIEIAGSYGLSDFLDENGMTVYTVGKFKTYSEALKARKYLINNNAPGAFIVAFRGYKQIPVNEAIRITEKD